MLNTMLPFFFFLLNSIIYFFRFFITSYIPRAVTGCGEATYTMIKLIQLLQRLVKKQNFILLRSSSLSSLNNNQFNMKDDRYNRNERSTTQYLIPKDILCWANSVSRRTPVFVINLSRRPDRCRIYSLK